MSRRYPMNFPTIAVVVFAALHGPWVCAQTTPTIASTPKGSTILSPGNTASLTGRLGKEAIPKIAPIKFAPAAVRAAPRKATPPAPPPLVGRGDEASYATRNMLGAQAPGNNRFGGHTYAMPLDAIAVDFTDGLAGFFSFDKLGTLREAKVFRANGTSMTTLYDARSGDISTSTTDTPAPEANIMAGGMVVMPGTSLSGLIKHGVPMAAPGGSGKVEAIEGINRLIAPTAP